MQAGVPQERLPALLSAMDAFVLPSRGEGWGRPHVEAMAMGLPVIATNWSGPTEYVSSAKRKFSVYLLCFVTRDVTTFDTDSFYSELRYSRLLTTIYVWLGFAFVA